MQETLKDSKTRLVFVLQIMRYTGNSGTTNNYVYYLKYPVQ